MTINMATNQTSTASYMDFSKLKTSSAGNQKKTDSTDSVKTQRPSGPPPDVEGMEKPSGPPPDSANMQQRQGASGSAQTGTSGTDELSDEEKKYDADGDGTLSVKEQTAYMEAKLREKSLETTSKSTASGDAATVSISEQALKLQKEGRQEGFPQGMLQGPPPNINEMSDEDLKSMLSGMKEKNGQLPKELSDYNDADIENLSEEDLNSIRETMSQMQEKKTQRMNAITEYGKYNTLGAGVDA